MDEGYNSLQLWDKKQRYPKIRTVVKERPWMPKEKRMGVGTLITPSQVKKAEMEIGASLLTNIKKPHPVRKGEGLLRSFTWSMEYF